MTTVTTITTTAAVRAHLATSTMLGRVQAATQHRDSQRNERGEGVISMAIAVLIMAILGGMMFYAYRTIFRTSSERVNSIVTDLTNQPLTQ